MRATELVQPRRGILLGVVCFAAFSASAQERPEPREILRTVRVAQGAQDRSVTGQLRTGGKKVPFRLTMKDNTVRWEFQDPPQTLLLRLGESSSSLEEITPDGKVKVG